MEVVQRLVQSGGPGLIDQKNLAGLTAVGEAEMVEWDDGARWLVSQMNLDTGAEVRDTDGDEDVPTEDVDGQTKMDVDSETSTKAVPTSPSA